MIHRKNIVILLLVCILLVGGYFYFRANQHGPMQGENAVAASVAAVIERTVTKWDEFSGVLNAVDRVEIRPRIGGTIESVHFQAGQLVTKGQLLFMIDPRPYTIEVTRAEAALAAAKSQASVANSDFTRARTLLAQHIISQQDFDSAKDRAFSADANVKANDAAFRQAKLNLEYTRIEAPVAGRISRSEITSGNLVNAGGEAPVLTTIVSIDPVYADFDVDEQSFVKYLHGSSNDPEKLKNIPVLAGLGNGTDFPYQGKVQSFDNSVNTRAGTVRVRAVFSNSTGALVPGLFARIRINGLVPEKALLVTERAIGTDQNKKFVMVVDGDNKASYREVTPGVAVDGLRVINEGLKAGEKIIVNGLQRIHPGTVITPEVVSMEVTDPNKH